MAGQSGAVDHVKVGDGVIVGAQSGVIGDVAPGEKLWGTPARKARDYLRALANLYKLEDLKKEVKALRKRLDSQTQHKDVA